MRHASLFSGIGGPEVAAAMLGWENVFHCEINGFGRKVLDFWFPDSESYEDITKTDFTKFRGTIDVLTGGFPCQPFSYAGKRGGQSDERYLWPEMLRAIDQIRPTWVIGENVAGITTMVESCEVTDLGSESTLFEEGNGIHRYFGELTFTIERICCDLESKGYSVQPMLIPACAVGAPHRRDRVFFIAHNDIASDSTNQGSLRESSTNATKEGKERISERNEVQWSNESADARSTMCSSTPNTDSWRLEGSEKGRRERPRNNAMWESGSILQGKPFINSKSEQSNRYRFDESEVGEQEQRESRGSGCNNDVTDSSSEGLERQNKSWCSEGRKRLQVRRNIAGCDIENDRELFNSDSHGHGLSESLCTRQNGHKGWNRQEFFTSFFTDSIGMLHPSQRWRSFPTVSPIHRGNDGIPFDVDSLSISFSKWRTETIKAYGNAIVPQVMYRIFEAVEAIENTK